LSHLHFDITYFIRQGFLENEECKIDFQNGKWGWYRRGFWTELATPFESPMNDNYNFVLDPSGKIYSVSKDKMERHEIRCSDKVWEWKDTDTGEWIEIPSPGDF
jgi:hypothetical protein